MTLAVERGKQGVCQCALRPRVSHLAPHREVLTPVTRVLRLCGMGSLRPGLVQGAMVRVRADLTLSLVLKPSSSLTRCL